MRLLGGDCHSVMDPALRLTGGLENVFGLSLVRGTTNSELERTRGIRLFN